MLVLVRADASVEIGTGHLMRCLTLANELKAAGARIVFACRNIKGKLRNSIVDSHFEIIDLPVGTTRNVASLAHSHWLDENWEVDANQTLDAISKIGRPDWLIVDHYALDIDWEKRVRPYVKKILVVDDLADRHHDCDVLLDQNLGSKKRLQYSALSLLSTRLLLGPKFALLRPEFSSGRSRVTIRQGSVRRVLVSFGGVDPTNETSKTVQALNRIPGISNGIDVVAGAGNPNAENVRRLCMDDRRIRFYREVSNMAELMAEADLAIGGCGATSWERCAMYLPAVAVVVSQNQREIAEGLAEANAAEIVGWHADVSDKDIELVLVKLCESPDRLKALSKAAGQLVDGKGVQRVVKEMEVMYGSARLLH